MALFVTGRFYLRHRCLSSHLQFPRERLFTTSRVNRQSKSPPNKPTDKLEYRPWLLIYTNSTARTSFISSLRTLSLILPLGGIAYTLAPTLVGTASATLTDLLPLMGTGLAIPLLTHLIYHSYVHSVSLALPAPARRSRRDLLAFVRALSPDAQLRIQQVRFFGGTLPRITVVRIGDLVAAPPKLGQLPNYATRKGKDRLFGFGHKFLIADEARGDARSKEPGVWVKVAQMIKNDEQLKSTKIVR